MPLLWCNDRAWECWQRLQRVISRWRNDGITTQKCWHRNRGSEAAVCQCSLASDGWRYRYSRDSKNVVMLANTLAVWSAVCPRRDRSCWTVVPAECGQAFRACAHQATHGDGCVLVATVRNVFHTSMHDQIQTALWTTSLLVMHCGRPGGRNVHQRCGWTHAWWREFFCWFSLMYVSLRCRCIFIVDNARNYKYKAACEVFPMKYRTIPYHRVICGDGKEIAIS